MGAEAAQPESLDHRPARLQGGERGVGAPPVATSATFIGRPISSSMP